MDTSVDPSQAAFVPGRMIVDNILLSHELEKGYGRKGISPRSMMKIDIGDARFVQLLFDTFQDFSKGSGLIANTSKSSIYFGGVSIAEQDQIMAYTGFTRGNMTFIYLRVPVSTKILSIAQSQLIRSVLISMQKYWSEIFILPKKISQLIEQMCKRFLWTGKVEVTKKALIAWSRLCQPQLTGGINIIDMEIWNKAAISKLLWNMCTKKDRLWIRWIHAYYVKGRCIWEIEPKQATWVIQNIFKAKQHFIDVGIPLDTIHTMSSLTIKAIYQS
ncbi:hypothetical protein R3W88_004179 [Solanum pinnatisectum]|uniref:Reverse transcriptase n=1 Tax=Solanum pinnatisectum TaxID=50273 RepID=A0AAV9K8J2_9SOLN|nr:hypothetical protein R3W88_004179 [Solanum pinnatisectum]